MRIVEIMLSVLATFGALSIFLAKFPGSILLSIISLTLLAVMYFPLGVVTLGGLKTKTDTKDQDETKMMIAGVVGFGLGVTIIGTMFKILIWPGASINILIGLIVSIPLLVVSIYKFSRSEKDHCFYRGIIIRLVLVLLVGLFLYLIPMKTMLTWRHPDHPEYVNAYIEYRMDPNNPEKAAEFEKQSDLLYEQP